MRTIFKSLCLLIACSSVVSSVFAQKIERSTDTVKKSTTPANIVKPKGPKAISREVNVGLSMHSNGGMILGLFDLYVDIGRVKPRDPKHPDMFYNLRFWRVEIGEKKHQKEYKISGNSGGSGSNSYVYGKINNFYSLKLGRGYMRMLAGKPDPGSVSIHWLYAGGFSLGMLKPYYLNTVSDPTAIKYDGDNKEDFLDQRYIQGNAGFSKGLGEMKYIPGFHLTSAIHFDFSANRKSVIGVEVGANAEYYTQDIEIMANTKPSKFLMDIYVAFQLGKRW